MARIRFEPDQRESLQQVGLETTLSFTADDGLHLAALAGEALARKRGGALRLGYRPVHTCGVFVRGTFVPSGGAGQGAPAHLQGTTPSRVLARFSNCDAREAVDDRRLAPRGLAVRFELVDGRTTDLLAMSTNCFPASTYAGFVAVSHALSSGLLQRGPRVLFVKAMRQLRSLRKFVTAFSPRSYAYCDFYAIHTFVWTNAAGQPVRYRWRAVARRKRMWPWTRHFARHNYLVEDLARRLGPGVEFDLQVQLPRRVSPARLRDVGRPLPRGVPWRTVGRVSLDTPVPADEAETLDRIVFSPAHLIAGVEPYPGDEIFAARVAAYPASHVYRCGGSP